MKLAIILLRAGYSFLGAGTPSIIVALLLMSPMPPNVRFAVMFYVVGTCWLIGTILLYRWRWIWHGSMLQFESDVK